MTIYKKKRGESCLFCTVVKFYLLFFFVIKKEQKINENAEKFLEMFFFFLLQKKFLFGSIFIFFFCTFFDLNLMPIVFLGGVLFFFEEGHLWRKKIVIHVFHF
jgi:hypothetical protein